ncbi:MAG: bifunctional isocitrate dehydrogenase kinase/phosphatase [Gammaproteobacteria bacterium]
MDQPNRRQLVFEAGKSIHEAFAKYNDNFGRITRRAKDRFETRDWRGAERDFVERLDLWTKSVDRTVAALTRQLSPIGLERALWAEVKHSFGERVSGIADGAFCKTYFNSVSRRLFHTVGADPQTEFLDIRFNVRDAQRYAIDHKSYLNWGNPETVIHELLDEYRFDTDYVDIARDEERIADTLEMHAANRADGAELLRLDFLPAVFYQSTGAYLIGQAFWPGYSSPFVVEFRHVEQGIEVGQILTDVDDISILFGFTRSYFFVDIEPVEGAIYFIHSLLPHKPIDELYTVLGRVRQGKTERYRQFTSHLANCQDRFIHAAGDRGLVMIVFTLPSYDLVFKVIRDRFGYPKNTTRDEVIEKYQLVFKHDRAGRLIDTQEFTHIGFPLAKFDSAVVDELMQEAAESSRVDGDQLVIRHLYVERRLQPLNLFLRECTRDAGNAAVIDYGNAIKDLAQTNVFPGDLLLKNFGVTRHGRVIFYDYDELCLVTDCNFREVPEARYEEDELRQESWFYVHGNDVFPEEFMRFLAMDDAYRQVFMAHHADLLTVEYWRDAKARHLANAVAAPPSGLRTGPGSRQARPASARGASG